jgi:hypothetical protein
MSLAARVTGDLHLSAQTISQSLISQLELLGFVRDLFANNTRCEASEYHGTYRGLIQIPSDDIWERTAKLLESACDFVGGLEEEIILPEERFSLHFSHLQEPHITSELSQIPLKFINVPPGKYKACDIHLSLILDATSTDPLEALEALQFVTFDKPSPDGVRRIYTTTCESVSDGQLILGTLQKLLPRIGPLTGKLKMERTTRHIRLPEDATCLPLLPSEFSRTWSSKVLELLLTHE